MLPLFVTKSKAKAAPTGKDGHSSTTTKRSHVAICTFAYPPQPETLFLLSRKIAAANRDVLVTVFTDSSNSSYFHWFWDPKEDHNLSFAAVGGWSPGPPDPTLEDLLKVYMDDIGQNLRESFDMFERALEAKITYIVADAFLAGVCSQIADERGVAWSAVWNSSATSLASYMHADEIQRKILESIINVTPVVPVLPQATARSLNNVAHFLPGFPQGIPTHYLPYGVLGTSSDDSPVTKLFQSMALSLPKAEAILMNSFQNLESSVATALLNKTFHFGGLFSHTLPFPPIELQRTNLIFFFLDGHVNSAFPGPVLYINLSDFNSVPDEELQALADALEALKVPFLWYIAPRWPRVELPEGFMAFVERTSKSDQGLVISYDWGGVRMELLERKVLSHKAVGMQLRKGSWSSVMESIATGVPIICRPEVKIFDHALNATLVSTWEIGAAVEGGMLTKYSAIDAINKVRVSPVMKTKIELLKRHAEEDAAEPNGNSAQNLNNFICLVTK